MFSIGNYNCTWKNCNFVSSLLHNSRHVCGNCICAVYVYLQGAVWSCREHCKNIHSLYIFPALPPSVSCLHVDVMDREVLKTPSSSKRRVNTAAVDRCEENNTFAKIFSIFCRICLRSHRAAREMKYMKELHMYLQFEILTSVLQFVTLCEWTAVQRGEASCFFSE